MTDDTITYDYAAIDQCLSMMSKKAQEIQTQTDNLESDVKKIMVDWEGATAQSYDRLANDLRNDLTQNRENLDNLNKTFDQAAQDMQDQDRRGGQNVAG